MNTFLFIATVVLVFVFVFPLMRLVAMKCGVIPPTHDHASLPEKADTTSQPVPMSGLPDRDPGDSAPTSGRSSFRYAASTIAGIIFLYSIVSGKLSVDALYTSSAPSPDPAHTTASESSALDWKLVDGVRWFRVTGTDSAGIGYTGWISELFLRDAPPEPSSDTKGIMEKIGLPSMKEKLEGARQLRKIGKALEQALSRD